MTTLGFFKSLYDSASINFTGTRSTHPIKLDVVAEHSVRHLNMQCLAAQVLPAYLRFSTGRKPRNRRWQREEEEEEKKESKMEADVCRARSRGDCLDVPQRQSCRQCTGPSYRVTVLHIATPSYSVYIYCLRASTNRVSSTALSFPLTITYRTSLRFSQHALTRKFVRCGIYR